jgi:hypothetical protein
MFIIKEWLSLIFFALLFAGCSKNSEPTNHISFGQPHRVRIIDYEDHVMEPFLSRDGTSLFFNNLNHPLVNTNLHFATKINDSTFQYKGELKGVNTEFLEGVPSMDISNILYFISTRSYDQTLSTIYKGDFSNGSVSNVQLVPGIPKNTAGWVNFDVEVSKDGNSLYYSKGLYDTMGGPYNSDLILAEKINNTFQNTNNQILENVNTEALEYGACISSNMLELYFTRSEQPLSELSMPQIYVATRNTTSEPFGAPYKIGNINGFVEAPTLSPDDQLIYYHKKEGEKYVLYMIRKE